MSRSDTRLPQVTDSLRGRAEVASLSSAVVQTADQPIEPQSGPAPSVEFQLRQIQAALNEERALRRQQEAQATRQVERMRRELEQVAETRAEGLAGDLRGKALAHAVRRHGCRQRQQPFLVTPGALGHCHYELHQLDGHRQQRVIESNQHRPTLDYAICHAILGTYGSLDY